MAKKKAAPARASVKKKTLDEKTIDQMTGMLTKLLADTFVLYVKTLNFHWNMIGPEFFMYHRLLEEQYQEMAQGIDDLAERIRQLGRVSPGSMEEFLKLSNMAEAIRPPSQNEMVKILVLDNEEIEETIHKANAFADSVLDQGTSDLLNGRIRAHAKNAWLLRSNLIRE